MKSSQGRINVKLGGKESGFMQYVSDLSNRTFCDNGCIYTAQYGNCQPHMTTEYLKKN